MGPEVLTDTMSRNISTIYGLVDVIMGTGHGVKGRRLIHLKHVSRGLWYGDRKRSRIYFVDNWWDRVEVLVRNIHGTVS